MTVWIALLRAVNVSGVNRLPMEAFRARLEALGLAEVRTYIQSGNAVFRSDLSGPALAERIADAVLADFGFRPPVLMRTAEEVAAALVVNPFKTEDGNKVHAFFTDRDMPRATEDFLASVAAPSERYALKGKVLWLYLPEGIGRSKLAKRVAGLPVDITGRNRKTVEALAALSAKVNA